jgi:hypothetical protein
VDVPASEGGGREATVDGVPFAVYEATPVQQGDLVLEPGALLLASTARVLRSMWSGGSDSVVLHEAQLRVTLQLAASAGSVSGRRTRQDVPGPWSWFGILTIDLAVLGELANGLGSGALLAFG